MDKLVQRKIRMSKKSEFKGLIQVMDDGTVKWFNTDLVKEFLKGHSGERFEFVIKKYRSMRQLKYYWVLVHIVADHLGYSDDEMHEIIKDKFLRIEYAHEETGEVFYRVKSTKELSKIEMSDLTEKLKQWAAQSFSVNLPDPDVQQKMEYEND